MKHFSISRWQRDPSLSWCMSRVFPNMGPPHYCTWEESESTSCAALVVRYGGECYIASSFAHGTYQARVSWFVPKFRFTSTLSLGKDSQGIPNAPACNLWGFFSRWCTGAPLVVLREQDIYLNFFGLAAQRVHHPLFLLARSGSLYIPCWCHRKLFAYLFWVRLNSCSMLSFYLPHQ